jgi:hypothetical protein
VSAGIAQSVYRLVTTWTVRGSNPGGGEFPAPVQNAPGANPASYTMGTRSFPKDKAAEACGVDNPPILTPRLKKKYKYNSNSPCDFMSGCRVNFISFFKGKDVLVHFIKAYGGSGDVASHILSK